MIPFIGYAPDVDPVTPGVFVNCSAIIPTTKGFKGAPSPVSGGYTALSAGCQGAVVVRKTDDSTRFFAGTASQLVEGSGGVYTDRSGTISGLGNANRWRFAQFDDTTLATAKTEILQFINTATTFASVTAIAPRGAIVETVNNFTFLFDVNDQGGIYDSAERTNGWWCAAKGGYSDFIPSITTEAATGTLHSTPGKITAGRRFGDQIVAYKLRSMYLGTYVGQPDIWSFALLPGEAGALSQEAVVNIGTPENPKHIFMGFDNFYIFDGSQAVPIGNTVKDTVFGELNAQYYYAAAALHDPIGKTVRFYYPVASSQNPDKCVVYNYLTGKWGRDNRQIEAVVEYSSPGVTYDNLGSSYSTYSDLPSLSYDVAFESQGSPQAGIFDTSHIFRTLTGASSSSSVTFGDVGDDVMVSTLVRAQLRFLTAPSTGSLVNFYRDNLSDSLTQDQTTTMVSGRFDVIRSARWHRLRVDLTGDHEFTAGQAVFEQDGEE